MIISYQQLSLSGSSRLTFGSAPQSAPGTDLRPLLITFAAAPLYRALLNSLYRQQNPRAHIQLNSLVQLKSFGRTAFPLYNPHRTR